MRTQQFQWIVIIVLILIMAVWTKHIEGVHHKVSTLQEQVSDLRLRVATLDELEAGRD